MASAKDRTLLAQIDAAAERDKQKRLLDEIMRPRPLDDFGARQSVLRGAPLERPRGSDNAAVAMGDGLLAGLFGGLKQIGVVHDQKMVDITDFLADKLGGNPNAVPAYREAKARAAAGRYELEAERQRLVSGLPDGWRRHAANAAYSTAMLAPATVASAAAKSPAPMAVLGFEQAGGDAYLEARAAGAVPLQAAGHGLASGLAEGVGEYVGGKLLMPLMRSGTAPTLKQAAGWLAGEPLSEVVTGNLQDASRTHFVETDADKWRRYRDTRLESSQNAAIQSLFGAPMQAGIGRAAHAVFHGAPAAPPMPVFRQPAPTDGKAAAELVAKVRGLQGNGGMVTRDVPRAAPKTRADLAALAQHPNVKKMLGLIAHTEGTDKLHGYHTLVGGRRINDLSRHPNAVGLVTKDGKSTAFGRYQITGSTADGLRKKYGFTDFSPQAQDEMAVALMAERGGLDAVLRGDVRAAAAKLGGTWVSLPTGTSRHQGKRSWSEVERFWGGLPAPLAGAVKTTHQGLKLKNREAVAGGSSEGGLYGLAHWFQENLAGDLKYFSAFNDAYHHSEAYFAKKGNRNTGAHGAGLAMDIVLANPKNSAKAVAAIKAHLVERGLREGADFQILDEYAKPSKGATGGHLDFRFTSKEAARRYAQGAVSGSPQALPSATGGDDGILNALSADNNADADLLRPEFAPDDAAADADGIREELAKLRGALDGKETEVWLGEKMRPARLRLMEADDLHPDTADTDNQYRDRNRAASQVQVNQIARNLQPKLLGDSHDAGTGAPTLADDGKTVIGGNGRLMALARAYADGGAEHYREWLLNHAESFGLRREDVAAMKRPVLVRRLSEKVDIGRAAVASNEGGGLGMSALEQARADADRLPDLGTLLPDADGELNTAANRDFIRAFVGKMPVNAQAQMADADGRLSQDGVRRLRNALLYRAYGNSASLSRMVESTEQGARNLVNAMVRVAPKIAKAREFIRAGAMHDADIAADLAAAAETLNRLREQGQSAADYLAQQQAFDDGLSDVQRDLLAFLEENKRSAKAVAALLDDYYDLLAAQGNPAQGGMFGDAAPDKRDLLARAKGKEQNNGQDGQDFRQPENESGGQSPAEADESDGQSASGGGDESGVGAATASARSRKLIADSTVALEWEGQSSTVLSYNGRHMVLLEIGGIRVPFYRSTGLGGKKDVEAGKWYPFFGFGMAQGALQWIVKSGGKGLPGRPDLNMNDYYGSKVLAEYARALDEVYPQEVLSGMDVPKAGDLLRLRLDADGKPQRLQQRDPMTGSVFATDMHGFTRQIMDAMGPPLQNDDTAGIERRIDAVVAQVEAAAEKQEVNGGKMSRSPKKDVEANIRRGRAAMNRALLDKTSVHRAMYRSDIGWVDFIWGSTGRVRPNGKTKGAMGISHIFDSRTRKDGMSAAEVARMLTETVPEVIARGETVARTEMGHSVALHIHHRGHRVSLSKQKGSNAWMLTAFKLHEDANGKGYDNTAPTVTDPTLSRVGKGASHAASGSKQAAETALPDTQAHSRRGRGLGAENGNNVPSYQDDVNVNAIRAKLSEVLGERANLVEVVSVRETMPQQARDLIGGGYEGWFDPKTRRVTLVAENLSPQRAVWAAWHELGHRGFALAGFADYQTVLREAGQNRFVAALAEKIMAQRAGGTVDDAAGRNRDAAVEEALVELYAAQRTGDWAHLAGRYGVAVPGSLKPQVRGWLARAADKLRGFLRQVFGRGLSDKEILGLLAEVHAAAGGKAADTDTVRYSRNAPSDASGSLKKWRNEMGELSAGVAAYNALADFVRPLLAKGKLANTHAPSFTTYMRDYRAQVGVAAETAKDIAQTGVKMSAAERELLSAVLERELPENAQVPPELADLAAAVREVLTQQGKDLVALGMLSADSEARFRDTYLPRLYQKHIGLFDGGDLAKQQKAFRRAAKSLGSAIDGSHLKGRGIFELVSQSQRAEYEAKGFEVREDFGSKGKHAGKLMMWRDYTPQERKQMGEVRDAVLRFTAGYVKTQGDIAKAVLFKRVAADADLASVSAVEGWLQVPENTIAGTGGVRRYGALAGMWVHPDVHYHLQQQFYIDSALQKIWRKVLGWWKITKTVYNPVAHVNNVVSNMAMLWSAGGRFRDLPQAALMLKRKDGLYREALEQGLIGEAADAGGLMELFVGLNGAADEGRALDGFLTRVLKRADNLSLNAVSKTGKAFQAAYRVEDEVFRLALYKLGRDRGLNPREAADYALTFMFDYSEVPQGIKALRDTGLLPFVSYTYKAVPALARAALTRPHRVLSVTAFLYGINALSYALLGGAADEDEERRYMPDYQKGFTAFGTPKLIRLPWNDGAGKPVFVDVYRWLPLGDFADTQNQMGGLPVPQWAVPNGPAVGHIATLLFNKDTFSGNDVVKPYMGAGEKAAVYAKWLAAQWLPASVGVPFSYHTNNVLDGLKNRFEGTKFAEVLEAMGYTGTTYRGEDRQLYRAGFGAFGVKLRGEKPADLAAAKQRKTAYEVREIRADMGRIRRDKTLSDDAREAKLARRQAAVERLMGGD